MAFEKKRVVELAKTKLYLIKRHGLHHPTNLEGYVYKRYETHLPPGTVRGTALLEVPIRVLDMVPEVEYSAKEFAWAKREVVNHLKQIQEKIDMARKKTTQQKAQTKKKVDKKVAKKTAAKAKTKTKAKKGTNKEIPDNAVLLKHLAKEFDMDPKEIRVHLRENKFKKPGFRWAWKPSDPQLKKIRASLKKATS